MFKITSHTFWVHFKSNSYAHFKKTIKFVSALYFINIFTIAFSFSQTTTNLHGLLVEHRVNPVGIDVNAPRFSWKLSGNEKELRQTAYKIQVQRNNSNFEVLVNSLDWNTEWITSDHSHLVEYKGKPLQSSSLYFWRVRIKNQQGKISEWSDPAQWITGMIDTKNELKADWIGFDEQYPTTPKGIEWFDIDSAQWIANPNAKKNVDAVSSYFSNFEIPQNVKRVMVGMEGNFSVRCFINGIEVLQGGRPDHIPSYLDITEYVKTGSNFIAFHVNECHNKFHTGVIASIRIENTKGEISKVYTDSTWKVTSQKLDLWDLKNYKSNVWEPVNVLGKPSAPNTTGQGPEKLFHPIFDSKVFSPPVVYLRKEFAIEKKIQFAVFHGTAQGIFDFYMNGKRISNTGFQPGYTQFDRVIDYVSFDVTQTVKNGTNAIGIALADGWYRGILLWFGREQFGKTTRFSGQLEIQYADGTQQTIKTDNTWKASFGPILQSDIMNGEIYDARLEQDGWNSAKFDDKSWKPVVVQNRTNDTFIQRQHLTEAVTISHELKTTKITEPKPSVYVIDFGQNFAGWVRLKVKESAGKSVYLRFAEDLNPNGTIYTDNLRGANPGDLYICKGNTEEVWEPRFTYHGFRYVQILGLSQKPTLETLTGIVAHSGGPITSTFSCSLPMLDRLYKNVLWSQRSNYFETMTDCPQRDERYGWVGDAHFFMATSAYNQNGASFFNKWFNDCVNTQNIKTGNISNGAPGYKPGAGNSQLDWSAAMMITPNIILRRYGDMQPIIDNYEALRKYMTQWEKFAKQVNEAKKSGKKPYSIIGDWVSIEKGTTKEFIGRIMGYILSIQMVEFAKITNHSSDVEVFTNLASHYKDEIIVKHIKSNGIVDGDTQCAYAYISRYGLYLPEQKDSIRKQFKERMIKDKYCVLTGFHGTGHLLQGLSAIGLIDEASKLIINENAPGWGGMIKRGATTIWEHWDGKYDDGSYYSPKMNSFNHYTFGGCGEWLMGFLVGLREETNGFKKVRIEPTVIPDLDWVSGSFESPYGTVSNRWERKNGKITMQITIPSNSSGLVVLPQNANKISIDGKSSNHQDIEIGSGIFEIIWNE